jgi:hypothetical protein
VRTSPTSSGSLNIPTTRNEFRGCAVNQCSQNRIYSIQCRVFFLVAVQHCKRLYGRPSDLGPRTNHTDGHKAYLEAVEGAFGMDFDYSQLHKMYGASLENEVRYSPAVSIDSNMKTARGTPDPRHASFVERQNLNMRMGIRPLHSLNQRLQQPWVCRRPALRVHEL